MQLLPELVLLALHLELLLNLGRTHLLGELQLGLCEDLVALILWRGLILWRLKIYV